MGNSPALQYRVNNPGFTLIEVLIAMTLLGVMIVLLFTSLKLCAQSWEQGEKKISQVNEVAVVHQFFRHYLVSAVPLWDDFSSKEGKTFAFQGRKQSMQFVSSFPASTARSGIQLFTLQLQQQDGDQVIKVTLTPFFPTASGEQWQQEEVILLRHVREFSLTYFGIAEELGESSWQDEWLEKELQPQLVKINIATDNGTFWPEMIVDLKLVSTLGTNELENNPNDKLEPPEERE